MHRVEALTDEVKRLHTEAREVREALAVHTRALKVRTWIVAVLLAAVVALGALAAAQLHTQVDASRRTSADLYQLCQLIGVLADPGQPPPATPRGVEIAKRAAALSKQLHC